MTDVTPCLWFDGMAEEAARFYCALIPGSGPVRVTPAPGGGAALVVEWEMLGRRFMGLNAGPGHPFTEAVSFLVECADQAEVDRLWEGLLTGGGSPIACGWLKDRFGLRWQIVPRRLMEILRGPESAGRSRAFEAMRHMVKLDEAGIERAFSGD